MSNKYKASVIVPSTDYSRLKNFLSHLSRQIVKPYARASEAEILNEDSSSMS